MPKEKWKRREEKLRKKRQGMQVSGRSVFTIQEILKKKAEQARKSKRKSKPKPR
jgi:hypothetical protein